MSQNPAQKIASAIVTTPGKLTSLAKRKYAARDRIKNHVSSKGANLESQLVPKFGIGKALINRAMRGEVNACLQVGELGNQGRRLSEFAPKVAEKVIDLIQGTQAYNEAIAEINVAAGSASTAIDRAANKVELADIKFVNDKTLRDMDFNGQKRIQATKQSYAVRYLRTKNAIDLYMAGIDGNYQELKQELQLDIRDTTLRESHQMETANHNLELGSRAKAEHKPLKQYGGNKTIGAIKQVLFGY